jgi:S1-C subfamily serine protease
MAIGNPLQFDSSVTVGVVSGKKRNAYIGATIPGLANIIQTDAAINFGNSGGPLLDAQGRVVGINTAIQRGGPDGLVEGIGFAIAINEARAAADQIRETGTVRRGFLGIGMNGQGITPSVRDYYGLPDQRGVLIDDVTRGGPAAKAGLRPGDVIRKIDGEPIGGNADLLSKVGALPPGRTIRVEVIREGKPFEADIKLGLRPTDIASDAADEPGEPETEEPDVAETTGLGVTVSAITPLERQRRRLPAGVEGVIVTDVEPDSPAADLIEANRVIITSVNDQPVRSPAEWARVTRALEPGQAVKIGVRMQGRATSLFLTVPKAAN